MVPLVHYLAEGRGGNAILGSISPYRLAERHPCGGNQFQDLFLQFGFVHVGHHRKDHLFRDKMLADKAAQHFRRNFPDRCLRAQNGRFQGMPGEEHALEAVIDIFRGVVLVRDNLVQHHTAFRLYLLVREGGLGGQFKQQARRLAQVFLEHGGMQDNLLLGGVGVEFAAQPVQVTADNGRAFAPGAAEQGMFHKVGDSGRVFSLVPGPAADGEGAVRYRSSALADGIAHPFFRGSASHLFRAMRFRSSAMKPTPVFSVILCLWI